MVKATKEVQRIASNDGLLLAAGGEGGLTDGQGRLVLERHKRTSYWLNWSDTKHLHETEKTNKLEDRIERLGP